MATNGESARRWLAENGQTSTPERLAQIRQNIAKRLAALPDDEEEEARGLLEALDVMDAYMTAATPEASAADDAVALDYSPLIPTGDEETAPTLSPEEKRAKFQQLLSQTRQP
ncbi:hypothetical protein ACWJJH_16025 [Endozoicomonadaceae bacterium StTr2]